MKVIRKIGLCLSAGAMVLALGSPLAHAAGNEVNEKTEFVFARLNLCTGQLVELTGTLHFVFNKTGQETDVVRWQVHLSGTDSEGNEYLLNGHQMVKGVPSSYHLILREVLVSKGPAPNQILTLEFSTPPPTFSVVTECVG